MQTQQKGGPGRLDYVSLIATGLLVEPGSFGGPMSEAHSTGEGADAADSGAANGADQNEFLKAAATIGIIGVGAALIEVALIPGIIIGVAAAYAPKYLPQATSKLQPMFKCAVRGVYKMGRKAREAVAEAHEQVQDIVAEVHAEDGSQPASGSPPEPHA
jgi:hypothetical protein